MPVLPSILSLTLVCLLLLGIYVVYKFRKFGLRQVARDWGLTLENFGACFGWCTLVGLLAGVIIAVWNHYSDNC